MKKIMLLLALSAMVVVLFAPMATARQHRDDATTMTATASATASATATASGTAAAGGGGGGGGKKGDKLPKTGGPAPMALLSGVILAGSGVVAWSYLRRREVS